MNDGCNGWWRMMLLMADGDDEEEEENFTPTFIWWMEIQRNKMSEIKWGELNVG